MNRVLIVSNNEPSKGWLTGLIKSVGYEAYQSSGNIEDVKNIIKAYDIDVVLLDIQENNDVLLDLGRKLKREKECLVVALEPLEDDLLKKSGEIGLDDVLLKPLDLHQLKVIMELIQQVKSFHIARVNYLKEQEELDKKEKKNSNVEIEIQREELIKTLDKESKRLVYQIKEWMNENDHLNDHLIAEIMDLIYQLVEYKDYKAHAHTMSVGVLSSMVAEKLGLGEKFVRDIEVAAPLHDLGKVGIPDSILLKKGKLTDEEFEIMKMHTIYGYKMLKDRSAYIFKLAAEIALYHHERWDGSGYPQGLKGEEIPISAQIVGVADSFDAMVSDRPYKKAMSFEETFREIESLSGILYSSKVVEKFMELRKDIEEYYLVHKDKYYSTHEREVSN